jgi:pimeloyl-ACP methyl ester carboxylesterase
MGAGDPVVLLHGIPESWYCWHNQIPVLARQFRVLAIDLKGYGQSDKRDGDYSAGEVARQVVELLDALGLHAFRLGGHDWGSAIADRIAMQVPDRVVQYIRTCLPVATYDLRRHPQHSGYREDPANAARLFRDADAYVRIWLETSCAPGKTPSELVIERMTEEFSYDGVADAVARYFRDMRKNPPVDYSRLTMPVLIVTGEHDPRQPAEYFMGLDELIPGFRGVVVLDGGHFLPHETPAELGVVMAGFYNWLLAPGCKAFDRARALGLPTMPKAPLEPASAGFSWGNAAP